MRLLVMPSEKLTHRSHVHVTGEEGDSDFAAESEILKAEDEVVSFLLVRFGTPVVGLSDGQSDQYVRQVGRGAATY